MPRETDPVQPTKIDFAENLRTATIELLQARLSDTVDLNTKTKQAHWKAKSSNFIALHEPFNRLLGELNDCADTIAERILALDGQPLGTAGGAANGSTLDEDPRKITTTADHIEVLSESFGHFGASVRRTIDETMAFDDKDATDVFTGVSPTFDKML